jgi:hypothetical protein
VERVERRGGVTFFDVFLEVAVALGRADFFAGFAV